MGISLTLQWMIGLAGYGSTKSLRKTATGSFASPAWGVTAT